jgi:hypothetical protein
MRRAVDAFMRELDNITLAETVSGQSAAADLLQISVPRQKEVAVPVPSPRARRTKPGRRAS